MSTCTPAPPVHHVPWQCKHHIEQASVIISSSNATSTHDQHTQEDKKASTHHSQHCTPFVSSNTQQPRAGYKQGTSGLTVLTSSLESDRLYPPTTWTSASTASSAMVRERTKERELAPEEQKRTGLINSQVNPIFLAFLARFHHRQRKVPVTGEERVACAGVASRGELPCAASLACMHRICAAIDV